MDVPEIYAAFFNINYYSIIMVQKARQLSRRTKDIVKEPTQRPEIYSKAALPVKIDVLKDEIMS